MWSCNSTFSWYCIGLNLAAIPKNLLHLVFAADFNGMQQQSKNMIPPYNSNWNKCHLKRFQCFVQTRSLLEMETDLESNAAESFMCAGMRIVVAKKGGERGALLFLVVSTV